MMFNDPDAKDINPMGLEDLPNRNLIEQAMIRNR